MNQIPDPIFKKKLPKISWKKIYAREYGVQYSEMAILCLSARAKHHIPQPSVDQIVIPEGNNTAFYIDATSWTKLVKSLNTAYTSNLKRLEDYEKKFIHDGENYLTTAKKLGKMDLKKLTNEKLCLLYQDYQEKIFLYSIFVWTAFILNNYVAERATVILDKYIRRNKREQERQDILNALFRPQRKTAILSLQDEILKYHGELRGKRFDKLHEKYKWLSCLDIHNKPWSKQEFKEHINSLSTVTSSKKEIPFIQYANQLQIETADLDYLLMAQRFVYIKDARDDYRRQGVFYTLKFFQELARRMGVKLNDISYLQESEIIAFLSGKLTISKKVITKRKKAFVLYLDVHKNLVCLSGDNINKALSLFGLLSKEKKVREIHGTVASKGEARGKVSIVKGVKDLKKVKNGNILVAVSTHPDYVPAMKRAAAIVTDEGGITSHAAIVSREYCIPCIVGTKNATTILKDGDAVVLDCSRGAIIIIKH